MFVELGDKRLDQELISCFLVDFKKSKEVILWFYNRFCGYRWRGIGDILTIELLNYWMKLIIKKIKSMNKNYNIGNYNIGFN